MTGLICAHGQGVWSNCDACRTVRMAAARAGAGERVPLPNGALELLDQALGRALSPGPNAPDFSRLSDDAQVAVRAAREGRLYDAVRLLERLDAAGGEWRRLADVVRMACGLAIACRAAARGDAPWALRLMDRLLSRLKTHAESG